MESQSRVARVPLGADNYWRFDCETGHLLYVVGAQVTTAGRAIDNASLRIYSFKDRKETTLVEDMRGYVLSEDGSKVLVAQGPGLQSLRRDSARRTIARRQLRLLGCMSIACPPKSGIRSSTKCGDGIATGSTFRTCTASTGMRCASSTSRCCKYVAHRSDLNYVISEMIAELTVQHAYIDGGDFQIPPRPRVGIAGRAF